MARLGLSGLVCIMCCFSQGNQTIFSSLLIGCKTKTENISRKGNMDLKRTVVYVRKYTVCYSYKFSLHIYKVLDRRNQA